MDFLSFWLNLMTIFNLKSEVDIFRNQKYEKIKKKLNLLDSMFTDLTFPPSEASLGVNSSNTATAIEWKRPPDLCENPKLFDQNFTMTKIEPGEMSCNSMVSAFRILSGIRELCYKIVVNHHQQEWNSQSKKGKYSGIFRFRFWRFGRWVEVVVDDFLPTIDGKLIFTHTSSEDEFWVPLVEKAYAKLVGSYDCLEGSHISDALVDMTGGVSEVIDIKSREYDSNDESKSELLNLISTEIADHSILCASVTAHSSDELGQRTEVGLIRGQVYHVTAVKKIFLGDLKIRNLLRGWEKISMIRLRDTGVKKCIQGSPNESVSSDNSEKDQFLYSTAKLTQLLSKNSIWARMKETSKERIGLNTDHDEEFWIPFEDFVSNLEELTIVRLFNRTKMVNRKKWHESSVRGNWRVGGKGSSNDRSGGGNVDSETFLKNPQYLFEINSEEEEEISIQMLQWDGVELVSPSSDSQVPQPLHRTLLVGLTIIKVESNRKCRLHKLVSLCRPVVSLDHQRKRELYYRGFFRRGTYLLIPTTYKPGAEGSFLIRIFSRKNVKLRELKCEIPNKRHTFSFLYRSPLWVTVIAVKEATGLETNKNVYFTIACENKKIKSQLSKNKKVIQWNDVFIFYRKHPDRPIVIKVYSRKLLKADNFLGWIELPALVNHSVTPLEETLLSKSNNPIEDAVIKLEVLTEDNIMAV